jgi:hypothetical protein
MVHGHPALLARLIAEIGPDEDHLHEWPGRWRAAHERPRF